MQKWLHVFHNIRLLHIEPHDTQKVNRDGHAVKYRGTDAQITRKAGNVTGDFVADGAPDGSLWSQKGKGCVGEGLDDVGDAQAED